MIALLLGLAGLPAMAQTDAPQPSPRSSEQLQAETEFHKAEAKHYRELWEKLLADNQELRGRVEGIEAPVFAKQIEVRQRDIDLNGRLYAKYIEAKQREYDFASEMMTVNRYIFQHQYVAAYIVLALVVCIVLVALWFAHVQLMAGLAPAQAVRKPRGRVARDDSKATPDAPALGAHEPVVPPPQFGTSLEASSQNVKVTSSVVGVIVLIISLAFLYIYTKEIYTIRTVDPYQPKLGNPFVGPNSAQPKTSEEKK